MAMGTEMDTEMTMKMNTDDLGIEMDTFSMEMNTETTMKMNTDILDAEMDRFTMEIVMDTVDLAADREIDLLR